MQISKNIQLDYEKRSQIMYKSNTLNQIQKIKKIQFNHFSAQLHFTGLLISPKEHPYKRIAPSTSKSMALPIK